MVGLYPSFTFFNKTLTFFLMSKKALGKFFLSVSVFSVEKLCGQFSFKKMYVIFLFAKTWHFLNVHLWNCTCTCDAHIAQSRPAAQAAAVLDLQAQPA